MESRRVAAISGGPRTAVVAAIPEEIAPLVGRLTNRNKAPLATEASGGWLSLTLGFLGDEPLAVLVTGDGAARARYGVRALLEAVPVSRLLAVGSAAGLSPDLVLTSDEKRRVRESVVPLEDASVLDLESAYFVAAAEDAGVPWVVIRAVLDTASETLPDFLHDCSGPGGEIQRPAVLRHAARHPRVIPDLLRMRSRIDLCGRALAEAVAGYLAVSGGVSARAAS
jgi:nucleoside phosphorylase